MRRWIWWLMPHWNARTRRQQVLAEARARQEVESRAAFVRIARMARILDQPTTVHPIVRPLLTRGQAARSES